MGARVIACASTDDKLAFARAHGAHEVVNYDERGLARRAQAHRRRSRHRRRVRSGGRPYSEPAVRSPRLAEDGIVVGFAAGEIRSCRSTWCCSRAAPFSACSGDPGSAATRTELQGRDRSARALVRRGKLVVPHSGGLSARRDADSAQGARRPQGDGQAGRAGVSQSSSANPALGSPARNRPPLSARRPTPRRPDPFERAAGRIAMLRTQVAGHHAQRGEQHGGIVGESRGAATRRARSRTACTK